jgi:hypothetical protein
MLLVRQPDVTKLREGGPRRRFRGLDEVGELLLAHADRFAKAMAGKFASMAEYVDL